jgi:chromate reductase, NAD(P)H dehydrogenase (quinone)
MTYILGLSGSLRRASFNSMLLDAAAQLAPAGTTVEIGSIRGIPLYDGDVEATEGFPTAVQELKKKVTATDGLLIVTPEYNNSMPGVLKNAIDWLSRPSGEIRTVFGGRPVAVIGATLGQGGTTLAQTAWLPVLRTLGTLPWFGGRLMGIGCRRGVRQNGQIDRRNNEAAPHGVHGRLRGVYFRAPPVKPRLPQWW